VGDLPVKPGQSIDKGLKEMTLLNLKGFPHSLHLVHAEGHGHGAGYSAGASGELMPKAIREAAAESGRPVDVVWAETCYGGNLEQLSRYVGGAKNVVAFEDAGPTSFAMTGRVPLSELVQRASQAVDAKTMAAEIAKAAGQHMSKDVQGFEGSHKSPIPPALRAKIGAEGLMLGGLDSTVAAYDIEALKQQLHPRLEALGQALSSQMARDENLRSILLKAGQDSTIDTQGDLVDMGGFLDRLTTAELDPHSRACVEQTLEALGQVVTERRTSEQFPLSGLSFHTKAINKKSLFGEFTQKISDPGKDSNLPAGWTDFVHKVWQ
jgi:hypothetical protein